MQLICTYALMADYQHPHILHIIIHIHSHSQINHSSDTYTHFTRGASKEQMTRPHPKCNYLKKTFIYMAFVSLNCLPGHIRPVKGRVCFKKKLKSYLHQHRI